MAKLIIVLLLTVLFCYASVLGAQKKAPQELKSGCELTGDDYAVYAALIAGLGHPEDPEEAWQGKQILVVDHTAGPGDTKSHWGTWGFRSKSKAAPSHDTLVNFERKGRSSCVLKPEFSDAAPYKLITQQELADAFKEGGWENFYRRYPEAGGVWTLSRPGYNSARSEAVLSVSHGCGLLCGTGHLYFLAKQNNEWVVVNRLMLWIS